MFGIFSFTPTLGQGSFDDMACPDCPSSDIPNDAKKESYTILMKTDKTSYNNADIISISGTIESATGVVSLLVYDTSGKIIWSENSNIKENGDFSTLLITGGTGWKKSGTYTLLAKYGEATSQVTFKFFYNEPEKKEGVPIWIKNNAKWWSQNQISDSDFVSGIEYLVIHKIILVSSIVDQSQSPQKSIPSWIRTYAGWWADGSISEGEFLSGIEYLVKTRIIKISNSYSEQEIPKQSSEGIQLQISVTTSKNSYTEGDTIVISGQVVSIIPDRPVTTQIFHEGNLVDIVQTTVAKDGKFTHTFLAQGPTWKNEGTYIVRASYGANSIVETHFEFFIKPTTSETTDIFEAKAGSKGTFDVKYSISGALVKDMVIDSDELKLVVFVEAKDDGVLTLELPRFAIDAKKSDGTDDAFILNIDGREVPYKEISTDADSRTISIKFEEGDSDLEIIGTNVI